MTNTQNDLRLAVKTLDSTVDHLSSAAGLVDPQGSYLEALHRLTEASATLAKVERETVALARSQGASWGQVALQLGTTRQAAQQRYGSRGAPATAQTEVLDLDPVHSVLPNFSLACGLDYLETTRSGARTVLGTREHGTDVKVTCSGCLSAYGDLDGLRAEIQRQQGHQA